MLIPDFHFTAADCFYKHKILLCALDRAQYSIFTVNTLIIILIDK